MRASLNAYGQRMRISITDSAPSQIQLRIVSTDRIFRGVDYEATVSVRPVDEGRTRLAMVGTVYRPLFAVSAIAATFTTLQNVTMTEIMRHRLLDRTWTPRSSLLAGFAYLVVFGLLGLLALVPFRASSAPTDVLVLTMALAVTGALITRFSTHAPRRNVRYAVFWTATAGTIVAAMIARRVLPDVFDTPKLEVVGSYIAWFGLLAALTATCTFIARRSWVRGAGSLMTAATALFLLLLLGQSDSSTSTIVPDRVKGPLTRLHAAIRPSPMQPEQYDDSERATPGAGDGETTLDQHA